MQILKDQPFLLSQSEILWEHWWGNGDQVMKHCSSFWRLLLVHTGSCLDQLVFLDSKDTPTARQVSRDPRGPGGTDLTLKK